MSYQGQNFVAPRQATWTQVNFITGSLTNTVGNGTTLYVPKATGDNLVALSTPAPATPYCAIFNISQNIGNYDPSTNIVLPVVGFYDGTKFITIFLEWSGSLTLKYGVFYWSNINTIVSALYGNTIYSAGYPSAMISWFQIRDDGTNIYFYIASDGGNEQPKHWVKLYQEARLTHLANVNKVIWGTDSNGNGSATYLTLNSFQTVAL